ncbi:Mannosyltransferase 1 CMT1 [Penicillium angulare]|uniref:Mannosyltransferase 1 CMT1 n=1 Tax=Penicillium angulare TaxID=116970 RepID=UPI002541C0FD|nr:Mannosyltransferase 1 CMT1 [Penicillium angulare]KAJ5272609.1 Mannosyltransferase 1 CMT1 [Penicillium angulare]
MGNFTIVNGQIYTPGLAIVDAPQPYTPLGGGKFQVKSHNFTLSNGTVPPSNSSGYVGPVLDLEPSSTVKHVNWVWPRCFVGSGDGDSSDGTARGAYNITMHQSFRWNDTDYYTVFNLPISVTNSISQSSDRVECDLLENEMVEAKNDGSDSLPGQPWLEGGSSSTATESGAAATSTSVGTRVQKKAALAAAGAVCWVFWHLMR